MATANGSASVSTLPTEALDLATRMYNAARSGQMDIFEQALPRGLPANMTNEKGDTLLMLAAYHGHAALVKLLLSHGADPNRLNDRGQSPLAGAVFKMEDDVIGALLDGGADPEYGLPNAMDCIRMFRREDRWREPFEQAPGRGKMGEGSGVESGTQAPDVNGEADVPKTEAELQQAYREAY